MTEEMPDAPAPDAPKKRPAFQFYPADWRKDVELRACSIAARGLWIDLMCVMHECEPYGHLVLNGLPMTPAKISGQIGVSASVISKLLAELLENGVARKTPDGAIYSKRMVDDERVRNARAAGGKDGAEHGAKGAEHGAKGGRPRGDKGGSETPLPRGSKPPPSSSSSSSASAEPPVGGKRRAAANPPPDRPDDVEPGTWSDWLAHRKAKRATVTATVLAEARAEAAKAGVTLDRFLAIWCARGTQGLQADWLKPHERGTNGQQRSFREVDEANAAARAAKWDPTVAAQPVKAAPTTNLAEVIDVTTRRLG